MLRPLRDWIVVNKVEKPASSLLLTHKEYDSVVFSIGPDVEEVKPKDKIIYNDYNAIEVGEQYMVREKDILAIYE